MELEGVRGGWSPGGGGKGGLPRTPKQSRSSEDFLSKKLGIHSRISGFMSFGCFLKTQTAEEMMIFDFELNAE